jgi:hypothetical protein
MNDLRTAAQQALEALECVDLQSLVPDYGSGHYSVARSDGPQVKSAITALRAALEEEAQQRFSDVYQEIEAALAEPVQLKEHCLWARNGNEPCPHVQQAEPVQEPVAWSHINGTSDTKWHPPQRKPLTDEQKQAIHNVTGASHSLICLVESYINGIKE